MRAKRAKQYRKLMNTYALSFGFRSPLQVLLDADIIRDAARYKMKLGGMLENTLGGYVIKPMITQCSIRHLYDAPASTEAEKLEKSNWIEVAKQAERRRCGHHELEKPLSTLECMESVIDSKGSGTNKHRYVVASQDPQVRATMREIPGVPLVYINRSVMILEPISTSTERIRDADERSKIRAGLKARRGAGAPVLKRKREDGDDDDIGTENIEDATEKPAARKKVKGPKGPNPLSTKKSKKKVKPKSVARTVEDERAVIRKVRELDPQADEKAVAAETAVVDLIGEGGAEGPRKRKRKRKPKESDAIVGESQAIELNVEE